MKNEPVVARKSALSPPARHWFFPLFSALLLLLLLSACGTPTPTPFPTLAGERVLTPAPIDTATPVPVATYRNDAGLFTLELPDTWEVEPRGLTPLGDHYRLGPAPVGPGPASSALFVAPTDELSAETAAEMLLCGSGCADQIMLEETTIGGQPALRTSFATEGATLEWFFVEHEDRLIFFTLHDPDTLLTRADLLDTFSFLDPESVANADHKVVTATSTTTPAATASPEAPATVEPAASATPSASTAESWQTVTVDEAGVAFELPAGWTVQTTSLPREWAPAADGEGTVGFRWQPLAPDQALERLLPAEAEIVASAPLTLTWDEGLSTTFTRAVSITVSRETGWEQHALFQVGLRGYDLYASAPARTSLQPLQSTLARALASLEVQEAQLPFDDPTAAAIAWFQALIEDPTGAAALAYMTPSLRAEIPSDGSPLALLALPSRFVLYNLTWLSDSGQEAVLEAELTLLDESIVRRQLTLVRDPLAGWQVNTLALTPPSS